MIICRICDRKFKNYIYLSKHIKKHNLKSNEYYDKYLKGTNEGICLECKNKTSYISISKGYRNYCSTKCLSNSKIINYKIKSTNLKKYGYEYPSKNKYIKNKIKETNIKKYGFKYSSKNEKIKYKIKDIQITNFLPELNRQLKLFNIDLIDEQYVNSKFIHKWKFIKCGHIFYKCWNNIKTSNNLICRICHPCISNNEKELLKYIKSLGFNNIIENSRDIIPPYELDIYIQNINIAIEFNGLYYHSNKFKDKYYHLNKTKLCQNKNIQLIHIFEDEWNNNKIAIKNRLKNILLYNC